MGDGKGIPIERDRIRTNTGLSKAKVDRLINHDIFTPHGRDEQDNRKTFFYENCVRVRAEIYKKASNGSGKNRYTLKEIGDLLTKEFGESDTLLLERLENETVKSIANDFLKKYC